MAHLGVCECNYQPFAGGHGSSRDVGVPDSREDWGAERQACQNPCLSVKRDTSLSLQDRQGRRAENLKITLQVQSTRQLGIKCPISDTVRGSFSDYLGCVGANQGPRACRRAARAAADPAIRVWQVDSSPDLYLIYPGMSRIGWLLPISDCSDLIKAWWTLPGGWAGKALLGEIVEVDLKGLKIRQQIVTGRRVCVW